MFWDRPLLAIESSCDETSASVVLGRKVLSNVVATQIEMHNKWGGVVPEHAARAHVQAILPVISEALEMAGVKPEGIAVTNRPGLVGSLSVGIASAKALSQLWGISLLGVHHLEGHLMSIFSEECTPQIPAFPILSLVVSGGHTELVLMEKPGEYRILGETIDDAAGEAFDKGARLLGLGYPGGRHLQELAIGGDPKRYSLPRGLSRDPFNFSFSGLKTAMLRLVEREGEDLNPADAAASLQEAIVDSLTKKSLAAWQETSAPTFSLVGGVAANKALRSRLEKEFTKRNTAFVTPPFDLCTDNAAMIGLAASFRFAREERDGWEMDAHPQSELPTAISD